LKYELIRNGTSMTEKALLVSIYTYKWLAGSWSSSVVLNYRVWW